MYMRARSLNGVLTLASELLKSDVKSGQILKLGFDEIEDKFGKMVKSYWVFSPDNDEVVSVDSD